MTTNIRFLLFFIFCAVCFETQANGHKYTLSFSEKLDSVSVRIELSKKQSSLLAHDSYSNLFIDRPKDCDSQDSLSFHESRIYLDTNTRCIKYTMRLVPKTDRRILRTTSNTVVSKLTQWLFLPNLSNHDTIKVDVDIPSNVNFSVPWKKLNNQPLTYEINHLPSRIQLFYFDQRPILLDVKKHQVA